MQTAVLFIVFNRPESTLRVLEAIRKAKPPRLYVASDGPRQERPDEANVVEEVRQLVLSKIDWPCKVETVFRAANLGCKLAVSSAINWFFDHEEMGIILEDDCLPHPSFFNYCEEMLIRYSGDYRIWHIGGNNYQDGIWRGDGDYYFSHNMHIWGWATWRDRWKHYDIKMQGLDRFLAEGELNRIFTLNENRSMWQKQLRWIAKGLDTWDIQWQFAIWKHRGLSIAPNVNLVMNIGFGSDATHTPDERSPLANRNIEELIVRNHPKEVRPDLKADEYEYLAYRKKPPFLKRVVFKLGVILKKFNA